MKEFKEGWINFWIGFYPFPFMRYIGNAAGFIVLFSISLGVYQIIQWLIK